MRFSRAEKTQKFKATETQPKHRVNTMKALVFGLLGVCLLAQTAESAAPPSPAMEYRTLCSRQGLCKQLSRLILGTDHLGNLPQVQTLEVLNEALKLGINTFDTAPIYTDKIEIRLGAWLARQNRTDLHVITKGGFPRDLGPGTYQSRLKTSKAEIVTQVSEELEKSRAQYRQKISIYLMHRDDADFNNYQRVKREQTPVQTVLEALSAPLLTQHFDFLGLSNWRTARVEEALQLAQTHPDFSQPLCNSPYFSLLEMGPVTIHSGGVQVKHAEMMRADFQRGISLMPYSPLGGFSIFSRGWESAKAHAYRLKMQKDRYWRNLFDAIFTEANHQRYLRAEAFAKAFNLQHQTHYSLDQFVNAYALAHPRSDFLIIGPRSVAQLRRTVEALKLAKALNAEDLDWLYGKESVSH